MRLSGKDGSVRQRIIKFEISADKAQGTILDSLTYAAGKLWNVANYERKCWTSDSGIKYPDWYEQKKRLKDHYWYKSLPTGTVKAAARSMAIILQASQNR